MLRYHIVRNQPEYLQVTIDFPRCEVERLFHDLSAFDVKFIAEVPYTLEKYFKESLNQKQKKEKNHVQ